MSGVATLFDEALLAEMLEGGFVRAQRHPTLPLTIYNYTASAQYTRTWNPVTIACRGLIVADDGQVVARPFPKFWNLHEHDAADPRLRLPYTVHEKLDGSLGVLWCYDGHAGVATRGTFESPQALWASKWWDAHGVGTPEGESWLFEIIYPANRVVVDYGKREGLVFLAALDSDTGRTLATEHPGFESAASFPVHEGMDPTDVLSLVGGDGEGVVLKFADDAEELRVKVKHDEYVRLHRLITHSSPRSVWEHLSQGGCVETMADNVPDEFHEWLRSTAAELTEAHDEIASEARFDFGTIWHLRGDRKAFAEEAKRTQYPSLVFSLLDGKDIEKAVWRLVRPTSSIPYFDESDDA